MNLFVYKRIISVLLVLGCLTFGRVASAVGPIHCSQAYQVISNHVAFPASPTEVVRFIHKSEKKYELLEQIPVIDLKSLTPIENDGATGAATYTAELRLRKVFLKVAGRTGAKEGLWMTFFNQMSLGVHFFGVTQLPEGPALVMEYAPGVNLKAAWQNPDSIPADFKLTPWMISEMRRQAKALYEKGYLHTDPQFLLSKDKVTILDLQEVATVEGRSPPESLENVMKDLDDFVEDWRSIGRVAED